MCSNCTVIRNDDAVSSKIQAMKLLITGAGGFIGRSLCAEARARELSIRAVTRKADVLSDSSDLVHVGSIHEQTDWQHALTGCDAVIHLAARAHLLKDSACDPLAEFRRVNTDGTLNLARQAVEAGVKRFVFVSSIGVNGAETAETPFNAETRVSPHSPYAMSKYEAEVKLQDLAFQSGLEVVIVRPPLVHGRGAPGNFGAMVRFLMRGIQLPLGAVTNNRRSLVGVDNLVDLLLLCAIHPAAANQIFLASDSEDVSTADLLRRIGMAMGKPVKLLPVPVSVLKFGAAALGRSDVAQRLLGSLQVDTSKNRQLLGWLPPVPLDEGLRRAVSDLG